MLSKRRLAGLIIPVLLAALFLTPIQEVRGAKDDNCFYIKFTYCDSIAYGDAAKIGETCGTYQVSGTYEVKFSSNKGIETVESNSRGTVRLKVDKTAVDEDLVIEIIPRDKNAKIYAADFMTTTTPSRDVPENGDNTYAGVETHINNDRVDNSNIPYHGIGLYVGKTYKMVCKSDFSRISVQEITGPCNIYFGTYKSLTIQGEINTNSEYRYASNGNSVTFSAGNQAYTSVGNVSTNNPAGAKNTRYDDMKKQLKLFENQISLVTTFALGVAILTGLLILILNCVKLASMPSHPIKRRECIFNILYCFICFALLGGITLFTKLAIQIVFG